MLRSIALILLAIVLACASYGQAPAAPSTVLERWEAQQRRAHVPLESLRFVENVERAIDSPFITRVVRVRYRCTVRNGELARDLIEGTVDGEAVETEVVLRMRRRMEKSLGSETALADAVATIPASFLARLRPVGEAQRDRVAERSAWRIELEPHRSEGMINRATVWFDEDLRRPRLLRSRLVLTGREQGSLMTVITGYGVIEGPAGAVAVARYQDVEAVVQQRRRWRTFTVLVDSERRIEDLQPTWRSARPARR